MKKCFYDKATKMSLDIKKNLMEDDYCFAILTDTKLSDTGDDTRENILTIDKEVGFDCLIHLGNILCGGSPKDISMCLLSSELSKYKKSIAKEKLYIAQGMNDGYRDERFVGQLAMNIISDKIWYDETKFIDSYGSVSRPADKPYYFVDEYDKKIRLIFLCSYYSMLDDANGLYEKYKTIDVEQAAWLKNDALNVEAGTTVLIFSHSIPKSRFETGVDPYVYNGNSTEAILMLLQQANKKGINIAGWFCGAYGYDSEIKVGGINFISINSQLPYKINTSKCDGVRFADNRELDTLNQDCWDAVVLNTKERKIKLFRFGAGIDREVSY